MKHLVCIFVVITGVALGYVMGSSTSAQPCLCGEDCKCCAACPCNH